MSRNVPVLAESILGQALQFDREDRDKLWASISDFPSRELTVSLWVKDQKLDGRGYLFAYKSEDARENYFSFGGLSDMAVHVGGRYYGKIDVSLDDGAWHHVAISWSRRNGSLKVYIDGVLLHERLDVHRARDIPQEGTLTIGVNPGKWSTDWAGALTGLIDDIRIYRRALHPDEISVLASANVDMANGTSLAIPSTPVVHAVSPSEAYVSWERVDGAVGYRLYRNGTMILTTGDTHFIDRELVPGTAVGYAVEAFDISGNFSARSEPASVAMPVSGSVLDLLPPGHWYEVVDSSIEKQLGKTPNVMSPWSGGAYDTKRGRLVIFGGGHGNYSGNELYAFDINDLKWYQLTRPTARELLSRTEPIYLDGRPSSVHTYDGLEYLPNVDRFFSSGGAIYGSGGCSGKTWLYDFDAQPPEDGWQLVEDSRAGCAMISAYDSLTGRVWYSAGQTLFEFNPLDLESPWTAHPGVFVDSFQFYMTAAIDPQSRILAALGGTGYGATPRVQVVYLDQMPIPRAVTLETTGATEIEDSDAAGFDFDPVSGRFIAWNGGASVYALDVEARKWTRLDPEYSNPIIPSAPAEKGTYGRFRYIPDKNIFILTNKVTENTFFYKLSEGNGIALPYPQLDFDAEPLAVPAGGNVLLVWESNDADSCLADGGWSGEKSLSGRETIGPILENTYFRLTCKSSAGDAVRQLVIKVVQENGDYGDSVDENENTPVEDDGNQNEAEEGAGDDSMGDSHQQGSETADSVNGDAMSPQERENHDTESLSDVQENGDMHINLVPADNGRRDETGGIGAWSGFADMIVIMLMTVMIMLRRRHRTGCLPARRPAQIICGVLLAGIFLPDAVAENNIKKVAQIGFVNVSSQVQREVPVTFGQVFSRGDVPQGYEIIIKVNDLVLPTQVDLKARHADSSVRHAVITTKLPVIPANDELTADIVARPAATATPPNDTGEVLQELLDSGFDARIHIDLNGPDGTEERVSSARQALLTGEVSVWLSGDLATEFIVKAPFLDENGLSHPHLTGRFAIRVYPGTPLVRVDAIVENNWTYVPGPRNFTYDARILIGNETLFEVQNLTHYHHARWHKVVWKGNEQTVYPRHDTRYLQRTRAIPHYDPNLKASESALSKVIQRRYEPMSNVWINDYMPEAGADRGIGPLPWWQALHVVSDADPRAYLAVLDGGDAGGSYSAHLRDINTDLPVSLDDYPRVTGDRYQYPKDQIIALCQDDCDTPLTRDTAHQPSIAFYPYLLTGDHYYLEELIFWANGNLISSSLAHREYEKGLFWTQQVRGQAWTLRTLAQAAYILPDDHPFKDYFLEKLGNNANFYKRAYLDGNYVNDKGEKIDFSNPLHVLVPRYLDTHGRPWMDDFFTFAVAYTVDLGFEDWRPLLEWKAKYPLARMASSDDEYCWIFGATYFARFGTGNGFTDNAQWIQSFQEYYDENWGSKTNSQGKAVRDMACAGEEMADYLGERYGRKFKIGEMEGYSASPMGYPANLQPALAYLVDFGLPASDTAWDRLYNRSVFPDYSFYPQFAITPRALNPDYAMPVIELFSASTDEVDIGGNIKLIWSVSGADECVATGEWSGVLPFSGSLDIEGITSDSLFNLVCQNENGKTSRSVLVSVIKREDTEEQGSQETEMLNSHVMSPDGDSGSDGNHAEQDSQASPAVDPDQAGNDPQVQDSLPESGGGGGGLGVVLAALLLIFIASIYRDRASVRGMS